MLRLSLSLLLAGTAVAGSAAAPGEVSRVRYLMGTVCEGAAYGPGAAEALEAAFDEIARLETILSDYRQDSELSRLNRSAASAPVRCSAELFDLIADSVRLSGETSGAFDITVAPLTAAWDLRGAGRIPSPAELAAARRRVGSSLLKIDAQQRTVRFLAEGMAIDPGGIGKGVALDAAARVLRSRGVEAALLDFGGQILAIGAPPGLPAWQVDIAHPQRRDEPAITVSLRDASASTSGQSERRVVVDGRTLGHIIDPRTGRPAPGPGSATALAASAAEADALSTALFVMGPKRGLAWAGARAGCAVIYLDEDGSGRLRVARAGSFTSNHPVPATRAGANGRGDAHGR